jgi:hypothetical protein
VNVLASAAVNGTISAEMSGALLPCCRGCERMSRDERPEDEEGQEGQDELYAAFEALGGQLTWDELTRLLGSGEYRPALVGQATLLLGGDAAAADEVVRASFAALREAGSEPGDPRQARAWLYREVVSRARSVRHRVTTRARSHLAPMSSPLPCRRVR